MRFTRNVPNESGWYWILSNGGPSKEQGFYRYVPEPAYVKHNDKTVTLVLVGSKNEILIAHENYSFYFGERIEKPSIEEVEGIDEEFLYKVQQKPDCNNNIIHDENGTIFFTDTNGKWHRENGPAVIFYNGDEHYYKHGVRHSFVSNIKKLQIWGECEKYPAIISNQGKIEYYSWYNEGLLHNFDGPSTFSHHKETNVITASFYLFGECFFREICNTKEEYKRACNNFKNLQEKMEASCTCKCLV